MLLDIESPRRKVSNFFQAYDPKIEDNYTNFHKFLPDAQEKTLKQSHHIFNLEIVNNSSNLILNEEINPLEYDDLNNTDLYFVKNQLSSEKKNDTISTTDGKSKNNQELLLSKKRNSNYKRKKVHSKFEKDNAVRKLNINYISFIVKFVNYNIKQLISKNHPLFANLCYEFKKRLNNDTFNELKNKTIGEILKKEGSNKNKRNIVYQKDENEKIYNSVYNTILKDLLDINYIQFFRQVYTQGQNSKFFEIHKNYKAPNKILFFDDFLNKEIQKDKKYGELYKERLKYISKSVFISEGFPFFETKTFNKNLFKNNFENHNV